MCIRWSQLGAFYPFSRNHNKIGAPAQDPTAFGAEAAAIIAAALRVRYSLLPLLYTLMFDAHTTGSTVARPPFFVAPGDAKAAAVTRQFMWGDSVLISPVLEPGARSVAAYFPPSSLWYDYFTGGVVSGAATLPAPLDTVRVHVRGGSVVPTQPPQHALTTAEARTLPFELATPPGCWCWMMVSASTRSPRGPSPGFGTLRPLRLRVGQCGRRWSTPGSQASWPPSAACGCSASAVRWRRSRAPGRPCRRRSGGTTRRRRCCRSRS